jgi:uncharacterized protein (TIGR03067 family)
MRLIGCVFAVALLSGGITHDQPTVDPNVLGNWSVVQRYYTPSDVTNPVGDLLTNLGGQVAITNDGKLSALDPGKAGTYLNLSCDTSQTPLAVDLTVPSDNRNPQVLKGIYRLSTGGVLSIAVGTGDQRPTAFNRPNDQILLVMKQATGQ